MHEFRSNGVTSAVLNLRQGNGSSASPKLDQAIVSHDDFPMPWTSVAETLADRSALLSVVIPLLNEEENLPDLYKRLKAALNTFAPRHEIIFVDDGSRDGSFAKLKQLWQQDQTITILRFRRNFGKAAALSAGFARTGGDYVVMMDADLQDQPEEIPNLIAKLDEGYDLVTGWKRQRHDPLGKTLPSKLFNRTVSRYFKLDIHDFNCGLKLMRAPVAKALKLQGDFHRFIPVLAANDGFRVAECPVEHAPRQHGVSKYGAKRLVTGMYDFCTSIVMTRFSQKPLHFFGTAGLLLTFMGLLIGAYLLTATILGSGGHLRPLWVVMALLILSGVQIYSTGLIAEMVSHQTHKERKNYTLAETLPARAEQHA